LKLSHVEALALADDLGVNRIHVASDCKVVIDDIAGGTNGRYGAIILEIKDHASRLRSLSLSKDALRILKHTT
jgi:hypothetical protein